MFAAAFRDQRRVPLRALLLLGLMPGLWDLPADVLMGAPVDYGGSSFDWRVQGRETGRWLLYSLWSAVILGGQTLVGLDIARQGTPPLRRLLEGVRFTPALFVAGAAALLSLQFLTVVAFGAGIDSDSPHVLTGLALALLLLVPVVCLVVASMMVTFPLVDRRQGLIDAIARVWEMFGRSLWPFFRLTVVSFVASGPLFAIGWATSDYVTNALMALVGPTFYLAWAHAYLHSSAALDQLSAAASGPSVAAQPRP
jgi:hypothetical protein